MQERKGNRNKEALSEDIRTGNTYYICGKPVSNVNKEVQQQESDMVVTMLDCA